MARKPKTPPRELPTIPQELVDQFVKGPMTAEAVQDAAMAFKKALIERALGAEIGHHLGYATGTERPPETTNQRNGRSAKTVPRTMAHWCCRSRETATPASSQS